MKRRRFLTAAAVALVASSAGATALYRRRSSPLLRELWLDLRERFDPLSERIHAHFADLTLDDDGVRAFVEDYRALGFENPATRSNSKFYLTYLGSTDYFTDERDPAAPVHYVAFFHPYIAPCRNPFARFDDDDA